MRSLIHHPRRIALAVSLSSVGALVAVGLVSAGAAAPLPALNEFRVGPTTSLSTPVTNPSGEMGDVTLSIATSTSVAAASLAATGDDTTEPVERVAPDPTGHAAGNVSESENSDGSDTEAPDVTESPEVSLSSDDEVDAGDESEVDTGDQAEVDEESGDAETRSPVATESTQVGGDHHSHDGGDDSDQEGGGD